MTMQTTSTPENTCSPEEPLFLEYEKADEEGNLRLSKSCAVTGVGPGNRVLEGPGNASTPVKNRGLVLGKTHENGVTTVHVKWDAGHESQIKVGLIQLEPRSKEWSEATRAEFRSLHPHVKASRGIHECLTFGTGKLDEHGFWEHGDPEAARTWERLFPEDAPCWPHSEEQLAEMFPNKKAA